VLSYLRLFYFLFFYFYNFEILLGATQNKMICYNSILGESIWNVFSVDLGCFRLCLDE
jgi:hypothetical protein